MILSSLYQIDSLPSCYISFLFLCNFNNDESVTEVDRDKGEGAVEDGQRSPNMTVKLYLGLCCHLMAMRGKTTREDICVTGIWDMCEWK